MKKVLNCNNLIKLKDAKAIEIIALFCCDFVFAVVMFLNIFVLKDKITNAVILSFIF